MAIGLFHIGLHMQALAVVAELWPGPWRMHGCGWGRRRAVSADKGRAEMPGVDF